MSTAAWRAANPERQREHTLRYNSAHREEGRARAAAWYAANREKAAAYDAAHPTKRAARAAPPPPMTREAKAAYHAAYRAAHREERAANTAAWRAAHPEKWTYYAAKRRGANLCEHAACLALGARPLAWMTNPHACYLCGAPVWQGVNLHMDHVIPIAKGGLHCADNLRPACAPCNRRKYTRLVA